MFLQYPQLLKKVDTFTGEIFSKHPDSFVCREGCSSCCVDGINVWRVEYDFIKESYKIRAKIPAGNDGEKCPLLDTGGRCTIYDARPIVCRLWGSPLFYNDAESGGGELSAPSSKVERDDGVLTCCSLNFIKNPELSELPKPDLLNVEVVLQTLSAINHLYCKQNDLDPTERLPLNQL